MEMAHRGKSRDGRYSRGDFLSVGRQNRESPCAVSAGKQNRDKPLALCRPVDKNRNKPLVLDACLLRAMNVVAV